MNNFEKIRNILNEGVKIKSKEAFSKEEAAKELKCAANELVFSDGVVKGIGVWLNDETGMAVHAKESPKEILGKFSKKRL
jgi:hypothetical protein